MASPVEAHLVLCDAAVSDPSSGKVHMLGAGWSLTSSPTPPQAVVVLMKIPWDRSNTPLDVQVQLYDGDGKPVEISTQDGLVAITGQGTVEAGRPAGVPAGVMLDASFVLNVGPLPLPPGRYEWRLTFAELEQCAPFTAR
jgi:hypothetical protein